MLLLLRYYHMDILSGQGPFCIKRLRKFFDCMIFEFVSTVCMEQADILRVSFHMLECFFYRFRRFMLFCAITCDFPVIKVCKDTYVILVCSSPYICQIAYYNIPVFSSWNWRFTTFSVLDSLQVSLCGMNCAVV